MAVLIGIAVILLLVLVLKPGEHAVHARGWTGFVAGPSPRETDEKVRPTGDLRIF